MPESLPLHVRSGGADGGVGAGGGSVAASYTWGAIVCVPAVTLRSFTLFFHSHSHSATSPGVTSLLLPITSTLWVTYLVIVSKNPRAPLVS